MKLKNFSIAAISMLSLAISNIVFAEELDEANNFFKSFKNEEKQKIEDPLDSLEQDLANLENTINSDNNPDVLINKIQENGKIKVKKEEIDDQASQDVVFLRNIPEGTRITMNKEFIILPQNKFIIFHNGKRVIESPIKSNPTTAFCFIELKPSGKARVIKEGKQFTVTKNVTENNVLVNKDNPDEKLKMYQTKLIVDNENIKWISCYSSVKVQDSDQLKPLTVKDLRVHSDTSFKLEFPAYEEI